ncbi:dihydroneopterin aldolase [Candidatus Liberibacter americanus]|uniref:7,8-dihydroneopterin aldolase n=1 Tax=Candidatus Liberibacter americanus str. Sao Paulo TaxID=1261131 RepID=U6B7V3_9HYPH|nr:dihydroneopterin aldolase [Candidatus Liberibacter americanus]AHA27941.1 Dihydroneopterin aldolase [Candidatus Liberibacter americanus str. Sao Paulo]EMS35838.1 dihydroneopterin aldolase [Candidatus Liberibacter americanus PW_SP]
MSKNYIIFLKNCAFFSNHGVYKEEEIKGQRFFVDIEMEIIKDSVLESDSLESTIDYSDVFAITEKVIMGTRHNLIESLASSIAKKLLKEFKRIVRVVVTVRKPSASIKGILDYVETRVEYTD